jgi:hypothetical protein
MKFAVFVGCVGIVLSATMADASPLRPCTGPEIVHPERSGVVVGLQCQVTPQSIAEAADVMRAERAGAGPPDRSRVSRPETGIDPVYGPCWKLIDFPNDYAEPCTYPPPPIPSTIEFSRQRAARPFVGPPRPDPWPQRDPFETTLDEEREYWRRKLLETLPESTDMLGNPFRPSPSWRQAPWGPGSQQGIAPPRRAVATPGRSGVNGELRLSFPRDGYVAAPSWPIYQPRVPPANIFLPPGSPTRDSGGCGRGPSAAC